MQRLYDLDKWHKLGPGRGLTLEGTRPRRVRLECNAPGEALLYLVDGNGNAHFLAMVKGRDAVEFQIAGEWSLVCDLEDTFVYTFDGSKLHFAIPEAETFTRIMERRPRDHQLEQVMAAATANTKRLLEQQSHQFASIMERRIAAIEALAAAPSGNGVVAGEQFSPNNPKPSDPPAG